MSGVSTLVEVHPASRSLQEAGAAEALRHKWIESEKAGCDLGDAALRQWMRSYWPRFVRNCWLEHLEGRVFWRELDRGDFNLLHRAFPDSELAVEIIRRIRSGGENLDILCWAHQRSLPRADLWNILNLLERLDINDHRVECHVLSRLAHAC